MGYKAIIFEGTGLGHIGKTMYDSVKKAQEKDIFLGMTSQCIDGRTRMTVYESGRDLLDFGIIPLENMIPEVALVKAMWAVGNTKNNEEIKKIMLENIASEISL
jgi:glutamyl-tRNA(Gln) amidotransferase subunit D